MLRMCYLMKGKTPHIFNIHHAHRENKFNAVELHERELWFVVGALPICYLLQ